MNGAESIARELVRHGVRAVFGVGGANVEHLFLAVQNHRPELRAILCKHEHNAGTAADAAARVDGGCGVVMATSGGATMNLVPALAEAYASRVPVLALIGEPPRALQGRGAFQDTSGRGDSVDARRVLSGVARFCARADDAERLSELVDEGMARALAGPQGPAVLLISRDLQEATVSGSLRAGESRSRTASSGGAVGWPIASEAPPPLAAASELLQAGRILVVAGDRVEREGLGPELIALVDACDARVCVTPDGRGAFDNRDPRFLGVLGAMGHAQVTSALIEATTVVLVGTALPVLARMGSEPHWANKKVVALHTESPFIGAARLVHISTALGPCLCELARRSARARIGRTPGDWPPAQLPSAETEDSGGRFDFASIFSAISPGLGRGGVLLVDAGNTGAASVHYLACPRDGRWLIAMGMAGMGYTFGAAVGAAVVSGERCTVLAGDGAFYMHGLESHTAIEHQLPITYILFDNRAHGMCLVREELLLGRRGDYNSFRRADLAGGLGAMFPSLPSYTCSTRAELTAGLGHACKSAGPVVLVVSCDEVEIPPFSAFAAAAAQRGLSAIPRN